MHKAVAARVIHPGGPSVPQPAAGVVTKAVAASASRPDPPAATALYTALWITRAEWRESMSKPGCQHG